MFPAINLGPLVLPTAAFTYIIGAWLCLSLTERVARRLDQDSERLTGLVTAVLISGVVGARLTFVALYWPAYRDNLLGIVWPINSGFNLAGGLFFGVAAAFFYGRYYQLKLAPTLDAVAPVIVAGLMVASLADFLGGPGYGTITAVPWGIDQFNITRHPVQIYELIVGALALATWWWLQKRALFAGQLFLATTAVYSFGRLFTDAFRENAWISAGGWHVIQIICFAAALVSVILLARSTLAANAPSPTPPDPAA